MWPWPRNARGDSLAPCSWAGRVLDKEESVLAAPGVGTGILITQGVPLKPERCSNGGE